MQSIIQQIQISSFDSWFFFIDLLYIFAALFAASKFPYYFLNFNIITNLSNNTSVPKISSITAGLVFLIAVVAGSILRRCMHESISQGLLGIAFYTILAIAVLFCRKAISLININPNFIASCNTNKNNACYYYEAGCAIASAFTISSVIYYFYELSIANLFLVCITLEFFLEIIVKILTTINKISVTNIIKNAEHILSIQIVSLKIHTALSITAAGALIDPDSGNSFLIASGLIVTTLGLLLITNLFLFLIQKLIFNIKSNLYILNPNISIETLCSNLLLLVGVDTTIILILN